MSELADVLLTRIRRPSPRAAIVERPALEERIAGALRQQRAVLLLAPAGFGKTMSLVRALERLPAHTPLAWLAADADDDLPRFASALLAALEPLDLPWRRSPEGLIAALDGSAASRKALAHGLVNALVGADVSHGLIVIDDLHRVADPQVTEFLDALLMALPPVWSLVLSTRAEPPPALTRLIVQGEAAEFLQQHLAFGEAEVRQLLASQPAPFDEAAVTPLLAATQGWPAALSLWLRSERRPAAAPQPPMLDAAARRHLFAYLGSEVLDTLPQPLALLLMRTSMLPALTAQRCATVAGDLQAGHWLALVEQRGLFVSRLDGDPPALVQHDLFRDFLDEQLQRRLPGELPQLLQRAADTEPDPVHRVAYLLRASALEAAAQALMDGATHLLARSGPGQVQRLLERFPSPQREALPAWHFVQARLAWLRWDWAALKASARRAGDGFATLGWDDMVRSAAVLHAQAQAGLGELDAASAELQVLRRLPLPAHDRAVLECAQSWVHAGLGPESATGEAIDRMTDALQSEGSPSLWYQCLPNFRFTSMPGAGPAIDRCVREALRVAGDDFVSLRIGADVLRTWRLLWQGDMAGAHDLLALVDDELRWHSVPRGQRWGADTVRMQLLALRGHAAEVHVLAEELTAQFPPGHAWRRATLSFWLRLCWLLGDEATWRRVHVQFRDGAARGEWPYIAAVSAVVEGQLGLLDGMPAAAEARLRAAIDALESIDTLGFRDTARALLALALVRDGRAGQAMPPLAEALSAPPGRVATLMLGHGPLRELAVAPWPVGAPAAMCSALAELAAESRRWRDGDAHEGTPTAPASTGMPLTARELTVLERVAAGESNKLIARALDLSPHTVKRHISNIFDKLDLTSRSQASAWLRTRG
jgi:LuxR family maltose regulon positive regulatory protein